MRSDEIKELRRELGELRARTRDVWARMPDTTPKDYSFAICSAAENCNEDSVSVLIGSTVHPMVGKAPEPNTRIANTGIFQCSTDGIVYAVPGDHPLWQPETSYGSGAIVTYDNGGGLKRWSRDSSGTSGETFDSNDWTEVEDATGWRVGHVPHAVSYGTAGDNSNSGNSYAAVTVSVSHDTSPAISVEARNPAKIEVTSGDRVVFWLYELADTYDAILINSESHGGGGGGGGGDGDELVASQSGQVADYLSAVLVDAPAQTAPNYGVDMVLDGATMYGRVNVPADPGKRLIIGEVAADVNVNDASFQITNCRPLADGEAVVGNQTVVGPIGSYNSGDTAIAVWDDTNSQWGDVTPARYGRLKGLVNEASGVTAGGTFTVDNLEICNGSRDPLASSVEVYLAKQDYADNAPVSVVWNDAQRRYEDDTPASLTSIVRVTSTITGRAGSTFGSGAATLGTLSSGAFSAGASVTVYNPSEMPVHGTGSATYLPVVKVDGEWVLAGPPLLETIEGYGAGAKHLVQCASDGSPKFAAGAPVVDIRIDGLNFVYDTGCDTDVSWATGEECGD